MNLFIMLSSKISEHPKLIVILTYKSLCPCFSFLLPFSFVKYLRKKWPSTKKKQTKLITRQKSYNKLRTRNNKNALRPKENIMCLPWKATNLTTTPTLPSHPQNKKKWAIFAHAGSLHGLPKFFSFNSIPHHFLA